jgi:hypothetical protein
VSCPINSVALVATKNGLPVQSPGGIASSRSVVPEADDRPDPAYAMSTITDRFPALGEARPPLVRCLSHNFLRLTPIGGGRTRTRSLPVLGPAAARRTPYDKVLRPKNSYHKVIQRLGCNCLARSRLSPFTPAWHAICLYDCLPNNCYVFNFPALNDHSRSTGTPRRL